LPLEIIFSEPQRSLKNFSAHPLSFSLIALIVIGLVALSSLYISTSKPSAPVDTHEGPNVLKIKGLYVGMDIDEAFKILNSLLGDRYSIELQKYDQSTASLFSIQLQSIDKGFLIVIHSLEGDRSEQIIFADSNKKVYGIYLPRNVFDELFNTKRVSIK